MRKNSYYVFHAVFADQVHRCGPTSTMDEVAAKILCVTPGTVRRWRLGRAMVPRTMCELLRLTLDERWAAYQQMTQRYRQHFKVTMLVSDLRPYHHAPANDHLNVVQLDAQSS